MSEEINKDNTQNLTDEEKEQKDLLEKKHKKFKDQGVKQMSYKEYMDLKARKSRRKKFSIPKPIKVLLHTPFVVVFIFGIFFIPYTLYLVIVNPYVGYRAPRPKEILTEQQKLEKERNKIYKRSTNEEQAGF